MPSFTDSNDMIGPKISQMVKEFWQKSTYGADSWGQCSVQLLIWSGG